MLSYTIWTGTLGSNYIVRPVGSNRGVKLTRPGKVITGVSQRPTENMRCVLCGGRTDNFGLLERWDSQRRHGSMNQDSIIAVTSRTTEHFMFNSVADEDAPTRICYPPTATCMAVWKRSMAGMDRGTRTARHALSLCMCK